ncbi:hypothetical protein PAPYR_189 [Paratrimastix pyriformis]|uniref:Uncharacterized protein n=1 Tax=Paratrimastix pyriformis TaxID=342808 RepID=A0ABQ8UYW2_9EUKA|nr:hypothetical protein PAPYR_189 [Paratrimastix pyriformis]
MKPQHFGFFLGLWALGSAVYWGTGILMNRLFFHMTPTYHDVIKAVPVGTSLHRVGSTTASADIPAATCTICPFPRCGLLCSMMPGAWLGMATFPCLALIYSSIRIPCGVAVWWAVQGMVQKLVTGMAQMYAANWTFKKFCPFGKAATAAEAAHHE